MSADKKLLEPNFNGFDEPKSNFCKFPLQIIDELPNITTISEMKVLLYILRHTWGFQEFDEGKKITLDEFENGRKRRNGSRIDNGTGLTIPSIRSGIKKAVEHGYISIETDDSDPARTKNYYSLSMKTLAKQSVIQGEKDLHPEVKSFSPRVKNFLPRTEKDTIERNLEREKAAQEREGDFDLIEMQELVKTELKQYDRKRAKKIASGLLGRLVGKDTDYNLDTPITHEQFKQFVTWWDGTKIKSDGEILTRPKNLSTVKSNVIEWQSLSTKPKTKTVFVVTEPIVQPSAEPPAYLPRKTPRPKRDYGKSLGETG